MRTHIVTAVVVVSAVAILRARHPCATPTALNSSNSGGIPFIAFRLERANSAATPTPVRVARLWRKIHASEECDGE